MKPCLNLTNDPSDLDFKYRNFKIKSDHVIAKSNQLVNNDRFLMSCSQENKQNHFFTKRTLATLTFDLVKANSTEFMFLPRLISM